LSRYTPLVEQIEPGTTVVTATRRLARELRRHYDQARAGSGLTAWESPDILPWDAWVRRAWDLGLGLDPGAPVVLEDAQLSFLWRDIIASDIREQHPGELALWNIEGSARAAISSLRLIREWGITADSLPPSRHPDHAGFRRWLAAYEKACADHHWVDRYTLPDLLDPAAHDDTPGALVIVGFDALNTQQKRLLEGLSGAGVGVDIRAPATAEFSETPCHAYESAELQWRAAAGWAAQCLREEPQAAVAIVVPDLAACRHQLVTCLTEVLAPAQAAHPGPSREHPFHVSLGEPLASHPVVGGLLLILDTLSAHRISLEQTESLLLSPWIGGYPDEAARRARAALTLRDKLPWEHTPRRLAGTLAAGDCPRFHAQLTAALTRLDAAPSMATLSTWSEVIAGLLSDLGWPGDTAALDSDQFQAMESALESVQRLGALELVCEKTSLGEAVSLLESGMAGRTFQPESGDAAIQVLDVREAAGLEFHCTWFANLTGDSWPPPASPDPFVPVRIQREAGCPEADIERTRQLALCAHRRIAASTPVFVQSRPVMDGDTELMASALIASCPADADAPLPADSLYQHLGSLPAALDSITDNCGPPYRGGPTAGGSGLVKSQSECPRGAFLRYRLGVREHEFNQPGLDPAQRGSLVHRVLEAVWTRLGDSRALGKTGDAALDQLIGEAIDSASARFRPASGCGDGFFLAQRQWLLNTLREWFDLERARRQPFSVVARERAVTLQLEGIELQFTIDRIDRFDDGSLGLIDYKTGAGQSAAGWFEERPVEPQMPLYALSMGGGKEAVSMIAFARIRLGECALDGLLDAGRHGEGATLGDHPGFKVQTPEKKLRSSDKFADWADHLPHWRSTLGELAREFRQGDAKINPRHDGVCPNCPTPSFCRSAGNTPREETGPVDERH
jgi:exodeoxyribonuclease-5